MRAPLRLTFPAALAGLDAKPLFGQVGVRITHGVMILRPRGLSRKTLLQQSTRSDAAEAAGITAILVKQTERAGYPCAYIASLIVSVALS